MQTRACVLLAASALALACSSRTVGEDDDAAGDSESTTGVDTTGETTGVMITIDTFDTGETTEPTGVEPVACSCIESTDLICDNANRPDALYDCDVPSPCDLVDFEAADPVVATCVLELLVNQDQPSRFDYLVQVPGGWGDDNYYGTFYILGPGEGIDLECLHPSFDCCAPPPPVPTPANYGIREPAYFQDCIGKADTVMTGCIFNGLSKQAIVPECAP